MPTLLLSSRYTQDSNILWKAAADLGWQIDRMTFASALQHTGGSELVFYGEALLADLFREHLGIKLIEPKADWLPSLPEVYLQRDIFLTTFKEALSIDRHLFFKPADDKTFPAAVYTSGSKLEDWSVEGCAPVLVSTPVIFEAEFRAFILDRKIATMSSSYTPDERDSSSSSFDPRDFLEILLEDVIVDIPPAVVIDVGHIRGRGWAVVEANPAWASGLYDCDPVAVLKVLKRACAGTYADARWVR